jgi:chemotaxis protein methyltransferase CheR
MGAEMAVDAADYEYVRRLVADDSALALRDGKEYLVQSRLAPLAEREGMRSVGELIEAVRAGAPDLRRQMVEALATHETLFFRDAHPFEALRQVVLPEILATGGAHRLAMWSAAAATGQEAYSLALLLREHFPRQIPVPFPRAPDRVILATDLSHQALARARAGRFSQLEVGRGLPVGLLVKHFEQHGREWQLHDEVRRMVTFRQLNLARPFPDDLPAMDLVLLRNILIYFDDAARLALLRRVSRVLRPGGFLLLGSAESIAGLEGSYDRVPVGRTTFYRRRG